MASSALKAIKHGFNGFSQITRIGSWENPRKSVQSDKIRGNPRESAKSVFDLHILASCVCREERLLCLSLVRLVEFRRLCEYLHLGQ
ncbi:MAG: hypothetical protein FWG87_06490 [Defluviitaleaceae bacterium]|nr:hypothetical protein [Defluviitaleaceae bacterium]